MKVGDMVKFNDNLNGSKDGCNIYMRKNAGKKGEIIDTYDNKALIESNGERWWYYTYSFKVIKTGFKFIS